MSSKNLEQATLLLVDAIPENLKALIDFLEQSGFRIIVAQIEKVKGFEVGGVDYIAKPIHYQEILACIHTHLTMRRLKQELEEQRVRFQTLSEAIVEGILMHDQGKILEINQAIIHAANSDANVVICGESGTGKELVARTIHQLSARREKHFVAVNCGAIPENLFEREFFGHRKGTFTGVIMDTPGYLAQAHKGTLFLDEIGELPALLQVKLLRALQECEYIPLGDIRSKRADIRIIAAANKDLKLLLQEGVIREDFFWRIRVLASVDRVFPQTVRQKQSLCFAARQSPRNVM